MEKHIDKYVYDNPNFKNEKVTMTVALPAYKCQDIIWLSLESLKNQVMIDFYWELICIEEYGYSRKHFIEYSKKFPNCKRVIHIGIDPIKIGIKRGKYKGIFPLINKWINIAQLADKNSKIFVMHAADDYSPPKRLYIHNEHFKNSKCIISSQPIGLFYNVIAKKSVIYNAINSKYRYKSPQPNMAYNLINVKKFVKPKTSKFNTHIDAHILKCILKGLGIEKLDKSNHLQDIDIDSENWKYGLFTDGFNTISKDRIKIYDMTFKNNFYVSYDNDLIKVIWGTIDYFKNLEYTKIEDYIPNNVLEKLNPSTLDNKSKLKKTIQKINSIENFENLNEKKINNCNCKLFVVVLVLIFAMYVYFN